MLGKRQTILFILTGFIAVILVMPGIALALPSWWPFSDKGIDYAINIKGVDAETMKWFKKLKLDEKNKDQPPKTADDLEQEAVDLGDRLKKALEAHGFYEAAIEHKIDKTKKTPEINYNIKPGTRYRFSSVNMVWPNNEEPLKNINISELHSKENDFVDVENVHIDLVKIYDEINKNSCLLALNVDPVVELTAERHLAKLNFIVTHGLKADFGKTTIVGNEKVSEKAVTRLVKWKQGECFDQKKVDATQTELIQGQLFSSVKITPGKVTDENGQAPIDVVVKERVPRTITLGASYGTDKGIGVNAGWEHRNYFGNGEKFNTELTLAEIEQSLNNTLRIPGFLRNDQTLSLNAGVSHEDTDAYKSDTIDTGANIERPLFDKAKGGIGIAYALKDTEDALTGSNMYALLSAPGFIEYDTRDNATDARKGLYQRLSITPYTDTFGEGGHFTKLQTITQGYISSDEIKFKPTIALRLSLGSIAGDGRVNIPSDIRYYAGGSGSVRGYGYQKLGPRVNGEVVGGSSLIETSTELRMKFTDKIGGVVFMDAGNAYTEQLPQVGNNLYYGAGTGVRYYSSLGTIRADVAVPVNGKSIGQEGFQVYVSIGQAF